MGWLSCHRHGPPPTTTTAATTAISSSSWSTAAHRVTTSSTSSPTSSIRSTGLQVPRNVSYDSYSWVVLLGGTGEGVLHSIITNNYGNFYLVRIKTLILPTIGCNLVSVKIAVRKDIVPIFDRENPRLEEFGV